MCHCDRDRATIDTPNGVEIIIYDIIIIFNINYDYSVLGITELILDHKNIIIMPVYSPRSSESRVNVPFNAI